MNASEVLKSKCQYIIGDINIDPLLENSLHSKIDRAVSSGAIDTDKVETDEGHAAGIAKCILSIYFSELARQYSPVSPDYQAEKKNLERFI